MKTGFLVLWNQSVMKNEKTMIMAQMMGAMMGVSIWGGAL
jgi:hypothetical protein